VTLESAAEPFTDFRELIHSISYLTLVHGITIGLCLTLATTHLVLVIRSEVGAQQKMFLASGVMAVAAAAAIFFELDKALAVDVASYLVAQRNMVFAVFVMILALLIFVRLYLSGRANTLFLVTAVVWTAAHAIQVLWYPDSFFAEVRELNTFQTSWGESFTKLATVPAASKYIADLGSVLVLIYVSLASLHAWKRGDRQQAVIVGGASAGFMLVGGILVPLDDAGLLHFTMPLGISFLLIVGALTYQLIDDRIRANRFRLEIEQLRRASLAGEIAAGLVHELNQPLTSILSNSQAARRFLDSDTPDMDEVRDALDDVIAEDKRAAGIIHGFRNLLRQDPPETTTIDVNDTIRRVVAMLAGDFHTAETKLRLSLDPEPMKVTAGEIQVQQVLINLLLNALRALKGKPQAGRLIELSSSTGEESVEITVRDSGPGLPEEIQSRIFEPFASGGDGLGMGLAICHRIITLHGGRIRAENAESGGAKFTFTLPLAKA
jgi:signal transduction histidine kinase